MSETYKELLVKRQGSFVMGVLRTVLIMLAVFFIITGFGSIFGLLIGVVLGIIAYFVYLNTDVEYEYLYLDKELSIDKVMAKTKRKKAASYVIERLEIMAPVNSHRLDSYNNGSRQWKTCDYTSKRKETKEACYVMIFEGTTKVIIEPDKEFVKAIYTNAPRKVFMD